MASLRPYRANLKNLQSQAKSLVETGLALNKLFAKEKTRLNREDEASKLTAVYRTIVEQLQRLKGIESSASHGHNQANLILSLGELAVGGIMKIASRNKQQSAIADYLLQSPTDKQPFGMVMVCIGFEGLPEDVQVLTISKLARESNRTEPEIINKLREDGYLLYSEEAFTLLISRLASDIGEGRLHLPVSWENLSEITASIKPKFKVRIVNAE